MRILTRPQSYLDIVPQQWAAVLEAYESLVPKDAYIHWDDVEQQPGTNGISHEAWWAALKMARSSRLRPVPITDKHGRHFSFCVPDELFGLLHQIDHTHPDTVVDPVMADCSAASALREESIASAVLSGATVDHDDAREMLRNGREPRDDSERAVLDLHRALGMVTGIRDRPLSVNLLITLNQYITGVKADEPPGVRLGGERSPERDSTAENPRKPLPVDEIYQRLEPICAFANAETPDFFVHPMIRAIILHFWLICERPFRAGNARTARALFQWAMLHQGYPLFMFVSVSPIMVRIPDRYAISIERVKTDDNDLTYFILHQAGIIREAVEALREKIAWKMSELREKGGKLKGFADLNPRQQAVMVHALHGTDVYYRIAGHQHSHGVTHQTARDDLFDLVRRELLEVGKEGRSYVFKAPVDLSRRLRTVGGSRGASAMPPSDELPTNLR